MPHEESRSARNASPEPSGVQTGSVLGPSTERRLGATRPSVDHTHSEESSSETVTARAPSGDSRGNRPGPAEVTGVTVPLRSRDTMDALTAAAGRYASVPLVEIATCAAPVVVPGGFARKMPWTIAAGVPTVFSERMLKGTANNVGPTAYTRCPVLRYRPSAPPSMSTVRTPEDSA